MIPKKTLEDKLPTAVIIFSGSMLVLLVAVIILQMVVYLGEQKDHDDFINKIQSTFSYCEEKYYEIKQDYECYAELEYFTNGEGYVVKSITTNDNIASIRGSDINGFPIIVILSKIEVN